MKKPSSLPPPPTWSKRMYIRIPRQDIAFFKFMLECEHNLALMTVVDKYEAALKLSYAPGQTREVECFVKRMEDEMEVQRIFLPEAGKGSSECW